MTRLDEVSAALIEELNRHDGGTATSAAMPGAENLTLFERLAWVALGQVASPKIAAAAFDALDEVGLLEPARLGPISPLELDAVLKQARVRLAIRSLRPLQQLARWATERGGLLTTESLADTATDSLRDEWRSINGIGPATADALLLEGLGRASFPVDRAAYRILVRHGWLDPTADYDEARELVERCVRRGSGLAADDRDDPSTVATLRALRLWFGRIGYEACKPSRARCERCPIQPWLPATGPVEVE